MRLAIVGNAGGTNVGESLRRAAFAQGHSVLFLDARSAVGGPRLLRSLVWRIGGRRPLRLNRFSADVLRACAEARPEVLIATGAAPLTSETLNALRGQGVVSVNFSTDDPWSAAARAEWHLRALPLYDLVFTPRRANSDDFARLGCRDVRYLPFGYDEALFAGPTALASAQPCDVLFVGGADRDRVKFITEFMKSGPPVALVGAYWDRFATTRPLTLGHKPPQALRALTTAAKVNICLARRANRDGHVMRTFEIAATGGCMLAEDTQEHREILGEDRESVVYFQTPAEAARLARALLADPRERLRLAAAAHDRIVFGHHTYSDRLATMVDAARPLLGRGVPDGARP